MVWPPKWNAISRQPLEAVPAKQGDALPCESRRRHEQNHPHTNLHESIEEFLDRQFRFENPPQIRE